MSALALERDGELSDLEPEARPVRDNVKRAREHRKGYEWNWHLNLAFASGNQWTEWDTRTRTLRRLRDVDPRYSQRELYTADVINEYRMTVLGELGSDNDRPELLLRRDDQVSEEYQSQLNRAIGYAWDNEFDGDSVLAEIDRFTVDLGTAAGRCRYDISAGPVKLDNVPHVNGRPVLNEQDAVGLLGDGPNPNVEMLPIRAGKLCWEPLSSLNLLPPPGVAHERNFPYDCIIRPVLLETVKDEYGEVAADLREDNDILSTLGLSLETNATNPAAIAIGDQAATRLRDHVWLVTYAERPTKRTPQGRVFTFAGNEMRLVDYEDRLPYVAPDGTYRFGISYFHWWRVTGRFWSRGLVDTMRDGQRAINKLRTQQNEIIDKSMPAIFVAENSKATQRLGLVNELIPLGQGETKPEFFSGSGPGPWMREAVDERREDVEHATGVRGPRIGENPTNVTTYSQLALLNEQDVTKREPIYVDRKRGIGHLIEDTVYDIRTYWGRDKHLMLAGDSDEIEASLFDATKIPPFFLVKIPKGSAKPRSQAAELQKVNDIWNAAVNSGATVQNPEAWVNWYKQSLEAGEALDLPGLGGGVDPGEKAELENHFLRAGTDMPIAYYDPHPVHLPMHRQAQDQALFSGDMVTWQRIERHCQLHINAAAAMAAAQMQQQQGQQQDPGAAGQEARANDLHQHEARKAAADADLAEKRAKQSDFTPKPSNPKGA